MNTKRFTTKAILRFFYIGQEINTGSEYILKNQDFAV
jgi:hypothetical protein